MARFYPDIEPNPQKSEAEYKLYRALKRLPDDWCVLHSVYVHQHGYKRSSEADFLIFSPKGIMVIEVKGGRVYSRDRIWYFENRRGEVNSKTESPYRQAETGWHALKRTAEMREGAKALLSKAAQGWGCYFPDCVIPHELVSANEWPREMICDAARLDGKPTEEIVAEMADFVFKKDYFLADQKGKMTPFELRPSEVEALVDLFRPSFDAVPSMLTSVDMADGLMLKLTSEQGDVLWRIGGADRLLVDGPAGTGKTLMAVTRFRALFSGDSSLRVGLLCFNGLLAEHLQTQNLLLAQTDRSFIGTVHELLRGYSPSLKANSADHAGCLKDLKAWAKDNPGGLYDVLLVDEGQDLRSQPVLCEALGLLLKSGWDNGRWVWFEDRSQSLIKGGADDFKPPYKNTYSLWKNVRNTLEIADFANKSVSNPAVPSDISGHKVNSILHRQDSQEGRYTELETAVNSLLAKGFKPEHIVILDYSGNNEHLALVKSIAKCNAYGWTSLPRRGVVRYSTVRKFKGMESPAVIVYNVSGTIEKDDPLFYVASTRPKISLTILATQDAMLSISRLLAG